MATTGSRKGQLILDKDGKKTTTTLGCQLDPTATDANTAAAMQALGGLQKYQITEMRVVDTKVITQ